LTVYEPSFATADGEPQPVLQGGWGGTSFVAPQVNCSTAVIDSYLRQRDRFWHPSIYAFAPSRNSPFTTLSQASTSDDNIFFTSNPGDVYNEVTGLGVANLTHKARDFAGNAGFDGLENGCVANERSLPGTRRDGSREGIVALEPIMAIRNCAKPVENR
jgi:hypothetical protein